MCLKEVGMCYRNIGRNMPRENSHYVFLFYFLGKSHTHTFGVSAPLHSARAQSEQGPRLNSNSLLVQNSPQKYKCHMSRWTWACKEWVQVPSRPVHRRISYTWRYYLHHLNYSDIDIPKDRKGWISHIRTSPTFKMDVCWVPEKGETRLASEADGCLYATVLEHPPSPSFSKSSRSGMATTGRENLPLGTTKSSFVKVLWFIETIPAEKKIRHLLSKLLLSSWRLCWKAKQHNWALFFQVSSSSWISRVLYLGRLQKAKKVKQTTEVGTDAAYEVVSSKQHSCHTKN